MHCHQAFDLNKGGSVGYVSTLYASYVKYGNFITKNKNQINFLFPNIGVKDRLTNFVLRDVIDSRFTYINDFKNPDGLQNLINERKRWFKEILPPSEYSKIDLRNIKSIHIHGAYNFLPVYNFLKSQDLDGKVIKILTTHNPYKPEFEDLELISRGRQWKDADIRTLKYFYNERDLWSFKLAVALIFPSEFSMEGYFKTWPEFREIIKNKRIYFCTTGGQKKGSSISAKLLKESLGIPESAKVFLYLGRFVNVRGYDILIKAAKEILKNTSSPIYFVVVGESFKTPEISDKRWIQIPFTTSPGDFLEMADAALCPNRGSLFDLSMIEILASSTPLICSEVGGYKYLRNKTDGVFYTEPENVKSLISAILDFCELSKDQIISLGKSNFALYEDELSLEKFYLNYSSCVDQIYEDFNIRKSETNIKQIDIQDIDLQKDFRSIKENSFIVSNPININKTKVTEKTASPVQKTIAATKAVIQNRKQDNHAVQVVTSSKSLTPTQRKLRKLIRNPRLYFEDFFKKHF